MGQIGFSGRRGATGDAAHRPSVATHPKSQFGPPKAALPRPLARRAVPRDVCASGKPRNDARGRGSAVKPLQTKPELL